MHFANLVAKNFSLTYCITFLKSWQNELKLLTIKINVGHFFYFSVTLGC